MKDGSEKDSKATTEPRPIKERELSPSMPRTVRQAAREWNVSDPTVRSWIGSRKVAVIRLGRSIRIPATEVRRLLENGYQPAERRTE